MKTTKTTVHFVLIAAAILGLLFVSVQLAFSAFAIVGILAIALADYRRTLHPVRAPLANVTAFRSAEDFLLAA